MPTAHLRGGPGDGQTFELPHLSDVFAYPVKPDPATWLRGENTSVFDGLKIAEYHRRLRPDLYPPTFVRRHGGPETGHWLFDWEEAPPVQRVKNVRIVSGKTIKAGPAVLCAVHTMILSELHQYGDFDRRDLEWSARPPKLWELQAGVMDEDDVVIRVEVVMEVAA